MNPPSAIGRLLLSAVCLSTLLQGINTSAAEANPIPPAGSFSRTTNGMLQLAFPYPGVQQYTVDLYSAGDPAGPYLPDTSLQLLLGPTLLITNAAPHRFYQATVTAIPMSSNALLSATLLNRLTYGPSPEDIERVAAIGPEQFIAEQLAADGIADDLDSAPPVTNSPPVAPPLTNWIRVSASGTATSTNFFIYLAAAGRVYIDDVRLVLGNVADAGPNLLINGDFEDPILTNGWTVAGIYSGSTITNSPTVDGQAASGSNCLLLVGTGAGSGGGSSLQQVFSPTNFPASQRFTLSFSYLPVRNSGSTVLTARLSGSATIRNEPLPSSGPVPPAPPAALSPIVAKLSSAAPPVSIDTIPPFLTTIADLRAYHMLRAVQGKRQLYEILVQFFENHFTTEYQKTEDYLDGAYVNSITNDNIRRNYAVELEWREHQKFRQALLNPNCTFLDLLKISVESPTMIIYLDTILSTRSAPNENYAREILELHTMGADNGYVQQGQTTLYQRRRGSPFRAVPRRAALQSDDRHQRVSRHQRHGRGLRGDQSPCESSADDGVPEREALPALRA